ncbi:MAG TPA: hypothetical protein VMX17_15800 [Candidatus Glassbacteria bacterium]|nr:hypothetical protein [Candidatus Glassbacteria bacterium]
MTKLSFSFIKRNDERIGQYSSHSRAVRAARLLSNTGIRHRVMLTTTYRNLDERICWMVILGIPGRGDRYQS